MGRCIFPLCLLIAVCSCDKESTSERKPTNAQESSDEDPPKKPSPTEQLLQAKKYAKSGRLDEAIELVQQVLVADSTNVKAAQLMPQLLYQAGNVADAATLCEEFAESMPEKENAFLTLAGQYWARQGNEERAINLFRNVIATSPESIDARLALYRVLRDKGFLFQANDQARHLIGRRPLAFNDLVGLIQPTFPSATFSEKPDPNDQTLRANVGQMNIASALQSRGDVRDAIDALKTNDWSGSEADAVNALHSWLLARTQSWDEHAELVRGKHDQLSKFPTYWMSLGIVALNQRDAGAAKCFANAIEREPNFPEAYDGLIQSLRMNDDAAQNTEALKAVTARRKQVADTRFFVDQIAGGHDRDGRMIQALGKLLQEMGRPMESLAWQELMILRVAPGSPQAATLVDYKSKVLQKYPSGRDESAVRCNLDLTKMPNEDSILAAVDSSESKGDGTRATSGSRTNVSQTEVPVFSDVASEKGLRFQYMNATKQLKRRFQIHQSLGSGVACLDYDRDGRVDFYFGQGGFEPPTGQSGLSNQLFRQVDDEFADVTDSTQTNDYGYTHGTTCGDWNQDGWPDIIVGNLGKNQVFLNRGDGTFQRAIMPGDMDGDGMFTTAIGIGDVTGDNLPDIVEVNYIDDERIYNPTKIGGTNGDVLQVGPLYYDAAVDRVVASQGNGQAQTITLGSSGDSEPGLASTGLGLMITDLDGQAGNEIFVANDQLPNHFWKRGLSDRTETTPSWSESAVPAGLAYATNGKPLACMGIAPADFDLDGSLDLHITNYVDEWSNLYLQKQQGIFQDEAARYGLDVPTNPNVGFGTQAIDYDNNGLTDLVIGNGHTEDFSDSGIAFQMPTQVLSRTGNRFVAAEVQGDDDYWSQPHLGRSLARCDWNRDGRVDFALTDLLEPSSLFENRCPNENHFLQIQLTGTTSERDAIGAKVRLVLGDDSYVQYVQSGDGYLSRNEPVLFFGLGTAKTVDQIEISWPSGESQSLTNVSVDQRVLIVEGDDAIWTQWTQ